MTILVMRNFTHAWVTPPRQPSDGWHTTWPGCRVTTRFYADESDRPPDSDDVIRRYGQLTTPPGERFYYTNLGYAVLGSVVARISGKTYAEFLHDEIFGPLDMRRADVATTPSLDRYRATRYLLDEARLPDYVTCCAAAADVAVSVHDLIRFGMLHLKARLPARRPLLSVQAIDEMQHSTVAIGNDLYGIGWVISRDVRGRRRVSHGGAGAGVDAQLTLMPDERLAVAVLVNAYVDRHLAGEIADATLDVLLGEPPRQTVPTLDVGQATPPTDVSPPGEWLGTWAGVVTTPERDLPVTLRVRTSGAVDAQLDDQPAVPVDNPKVQNGTFTGRMEGDIGTAAANRRPYKLDWDITLRQGVLMGTVNAIGCCGSRGVGLGYWVELRKLE